MFLFKLSARVFIFQLLNLCSTYAMENKSSQRDDYPKSTVRILPIDGGEIDEIPHPDQTINSNNAMVIEDESYTIVSYPSLGQQEYIQEDAQNLDINNRKRDGKDRILKHNRPKKKNKTSLPNNPDEMFSIILQQNTPHIFKIPDDVFGNIFSRLDISDILSFYSICNKYITNEKFQAYISQYYIKEFGIGDKMCGIINGFIDFCNTETSCKLHLMEEVEVSDILEPKHDLIILKTDNNTFDFIFNALGSVKRIPTPEGINPEDLNKFFQEYHKQDIQFLQWGHPLLQLITLEGYSPKRIDETIEEKIEKKKRKIKSLNLSMKDSDLLILHGGSSCAQPIDSSILKPLPYTIDGRYLEELDLSENNLNGIFNFLSNLLSNLRVLKIRNCNISNMTDWNLFLSDDNHLNKLEVLDFVGNEIKNDITTKNIISKLGKYNKLKSLHLSLDSFEGEERSSIADYTDENNILIPLAAHENLQTLELRGCKQSNIHSVSQLLSRIKNLNSLALFTKEFEMLNDAISIYDFSSVLNMQISLRKLALSLNVGSDLNLFVSSNLKNLKILDMNIPNNNIVRSLLNNSHLEELYFHGSINTDNFKYIQKQNHLTTLCLSNHHNISKEEINCLASMLVHLQNINNLSLIAYNLNGDYLSSLMKGLSTLRNLENLDLSFNSMSDIEICNVISSLKLKSFRCECYGIEAILGRGCKF